MKGLEAEKYEGLLRACRPFYHGDIPDKLAKFPQRILYSCEHTGFLLGGLMGESFKL